MRENMAMVVFGALSLALIAAISVPCIASTPLRATDSKSCRGGFSLQVGDSAESLNWNADETKLFVVDTGGGGCVIAFNHAAGTFSTCATHLPAGSEFDQSWPSQLWSLDKSVLSVTDLTNCAKPVTKKVFDFASNKYCGLPAGVNWSTFGGPSTDHRVFAAGFATHGQGTGNIVAVWTEGKGCHHWTTPTGSFVHNVKSSPDGQWVIVAFEGAQPHPGPYAWNQATGEVYWCTSACGGHWVAGNTLFANNAPLPGQKSPYKTGQWVARPYGGQPYELIVPYPVPPPLPLDAHASWPNSSNLIVETTTTTNSITSVMQNAIIGINPAGGPPTFYGPTGNSGKSKYFACAAAIGTVSGAGHYFMYTSDQEGTLGNDNQGNPRCDVFVRALQ